MTVLLQTRYPLIQFQRFRGKINIQRPKVPHYDRALVSAVSQPIFKEPINNKDCFKNIKKSALEPEVNPYNVIIAREVHNWLEHSKMVGIFHLNSMPSDDIFKVRVALHKQNIHLKSYGKKIIKMATENTPYEAIVELFDSKHCIVFCPEEKVNTLLKITKKVPQMILLAGIVQNTLMSRNEFHKYAQLNLQTSQVQLVNLLNMAGGKILQNLEAHQNAFVNVLDVYVKSKEVTVDGDSKAVEKISPAIEI